MNQIESCPRCGGRFPDGLDAREYEGICPDCLAGLAVEEEVVPSAADDPLAQAKKDPPPLKRGATFRGLEVLELLGQGGMGVVYKARQIELGRRVALKILSPRLAADPEFPKRFNREAQALAALDHPNIVRVHDVGREGELCYLVMELVEGHTLRDLLVQRKLSAAQALRLVPQLCDALEYAHSRGVIHRDVKPENILVSPEGTAKIADFGLAKIVRDDEIAASSLTETNVVMGTVNYMAPEQREGGREADPRSDIYALGVVLYELLTGELPVGRFDPPSRRAAVDARMDDVVLRALEKDPARRYQRASELGREVERLAGDVPEGAADCPIVDLETGRAVGRAPGRRFALRTVACFVAVEGWDRPDIGFHAYGDHQFDPDAATPRLQSGAKTQSIQLSVPRGVELDLSVDEASCGVKDVVGHVTIRIPDGYLNVERHDGSLRVQGAQGGVRIDGLRSEYFDVRTKAGHVQVSRLELTRGRGQVETESGMAVVEAAPHASFRYFAETKEGRVFGPPSGQVGGGGGWVTVRSARGNVRVAAAEQPVWRDFLNRLTPKQVEKIGVYVIVNAGLFLFFGLVAGTLLPAWMVAIFWGMGLGLELWKGYVRGAQVDGRPLAEAVGPVVKAVLKLAPTPTPQPAPKPAPPRPRTSGLAVLAFLLGLLGGLAALGSLIPTLLEMRHAALLGSDLAFARQLALGFGVAAFAAGSLAALTGMAASAHIAEAAGALRGRGVARAAVLLGALALFSTLGVVRPRLLRVQGEAQTARSAVESFFQAVEERRWEQAREVLAPALSDAEMEAARTKLREDGRTGPVGVYRIRVDPELRSARGSCMTRRYNLPTTIGAIEMEKKEGAWRVRALPDFMKPAGAFRR